MTRSLATPWFNRSGGHSESDGYFPRAAPPGHLHPVAAELREIAKATQELNEIIRNASLEPA
jgi:hypothetical protein